MTKAERQEELAKVIAFGLKDQWVAYLILVELGWEEELIGVVMA